MAESSRSARDKSNHLIRYPAVLARQGIRWFVWGQASSELKSRQSNQSYLQPESIVAVAVKKARCVELERRKHGRYGLCYAATVKFQEKGSIREMRAVSQNMSASGVLLRVAAPIACNSSVSLVIGIQENHMLRRVQLAAESEVVRVEPIESGTAFLVVIKCDQLMSEVSPQVLFAKL